MAATADKAPVSRGFAIFTGFLVTTLEGYDLQIMSSASLQLRQTMGLTESQTGIFFSATLIGLAIGALVGGWLGDRYGRKSVLIWSTVILGIFTFASALMTNYEGLLITRILAGIGLGGAMPTLIAIIAEVSGGKNTTSAVTTMICGHPAGGILSALVGKTVSDQYGWQSLFIIGGILTLAVIPMIIKFLPETRGPMHGAGSKAMPAGKAIFGEGRAASSLLLWFIFILTLALLSTLLSWTPTLIQGMGLDRSVQLNSVIALNVGGILGSLFISRAIDRVGMRWPLLFLYATIAIGLYFFAHADSATMLLLLAGVVGFGVLGAQFSLYGVAPRLYPMAGRSAGVGAAVAIGRLGSIFGPILIGGYLQRGASADQAVLVMAPVAIIAGLALFALTITSREALRAKPVAAPQV